MEKNLKTVKTITILLGAILIAVVAFVGLYVKNYGIWRNILPDFNLGMELDGKRELHYVLDNSEEEKEIYVDAGGNYAGEVKEETPSNTEISLDTNDQSAEKTEEPEEDKTEVEGYTKETRTIKANEDSSITKENFEKAKKVIQSRLEKMDVYEYNIRLDSITGEIIIELPDNENLSLEQALVSTVGKIEIIDYQNGLILMDDSTLKEAKMLASNNNNSYQAYLQLTFEKDGKDKLKDISNKYQTVTAEDGTETTNYISIKMDDQVISTTYFGEELATGVLQIPMGQATEDFDEYKEVAQSVSMIVDILNDDALPLKYTLSSDNRINSVLTNDVKLVAEIVTIVAIAVVSLYLIIRFKLEGLKASILTLGYLGLLNLILRYTNVAITVNALIATVAVVIINYIFVIKYLKRLESNQMKKIALLETMKKMYLAIIPICAISIIFTFMSSVVISSIGMILFWGLFLQALYNYLFIINV